MSNIIHDLYWDLDKKLCHDWRPDALHLTLQFTKPEEKGEKVNPRECRCRVWKLGSRDYLGYQGVICEGSYEKCREAYKRRFKDCYLELQIYEGYGFWDVYMDNMDEKYHDMKNAEYKAMEKADESRNWRPGDAPWDAPGMSISDFF